MQEELSDGTFVQNLGQYVWIIGKRLASMPTTTKYYTNPADWWTYYHTYGGAPSDYLGNRTTLGDMGMVSVLQIFCPLTRPRSGAAFTDGHYIRLTNKTGQYLRGLIANSGKGVSVWKMYNADGTYVDDLANPTWGQPWSQNQMLALTIADMDSDGNIVSGGGVQSVNVSYAGTNTTPTRISVYAGSRSSIGSNIAAWINRLESNLDPYEQGGASGPGGGDGDGGDDPSDVPFPSTPGWSALNTGFVKLYTPSISELQALASYLWSGAFDLNTFRKIFADPMDAILGLSVLPFAVSAGTATAVTVGSQVTTVTMPLVTSQYKEIDCGSITVHKQIGSYLDYDPMTKFEIYLPYLGLHRLAADDIMGKTITLKYVVDVLTGACVAMLRVDGTVLYSWAGNCSQQIPITSQNWSNVFSGALSVAATGAALVSGGGSFAPLVVAGMANTAINSQKPEIRRSGTLSAMSGMLGVQIPYLIESRPRLAIPSGQNTLIGYPSYISTKLGDIQGYTTVEQVHLEGIPATSGEIAEIENILKGGCIL